MGIKHQLVAAATLCTAVSTAAIAHDTQVHYRTADIESVSVFYREAGPSDAPVVLLLHGFGASSYMFRDLIPVLAQRYRVIAPDLPGFGQTTVNPSAHFDYTFEKVTEIIDAFTIEKGLSQYAIYVFDYGAPVGWRLATANPGKITAIVSQNGNAYEEGLSEGWADMRKVWDAPTAGNREALRRFNSPEMIKWQYTEGVPDTSLIAPETYQLASAAIERIGADPQVDLLSDYGSNVKHYVQLQAYFRRYQPPTLVMWGKNDPFFIPAGAEAFRRDNPKAEVHLLDTGHFAIETHGAEIAAGMLEFLDRNIER